MIELKPIHLSCTSVGNQVYHHHDVATILKQQSIKWKRLCNFGISYASIDVFNARAIYKCARQIANCSSICLAKYKKQTLHFVQKIIVEFHL